MKKLHVLSLAVAATLASTFAVAQTAAPRPHAMPDANGDGVVTKAEAAKFPKLAERFDRLDKNQDGKLSGDELPMRRAGMRGHAMRGHGGGMRALDTDHDGRISRAEMLAGEAKRAERFDRMDVNKDGYLDRTDMQLRREAFFTDADTNRDGKLGREEFVVEQGARSAERRAKFFAGRAGAEGKPARAPNDAERVQRLEQVFDRMDANKDGVLSKAEWDAARPMGGHGRGHGMERKPAPQG